MGCLTLSGLVAACGGSQGGIKTVKLIEFDAITSFTDTNGLVDTIVWADDYTGATFAFLKENSMWVEPTVGDGILASIHWEPAVTLVFRQMNKEARAEITEMSKGFLVAFIEDSNSTWWMIGADAGLALSAAAGGQSGAKMDELNGYTIVMNGKETFMAYEADMTSINFPEL